MHNKVVHTLSRAMNDLGVPALRFNFRGVGASEGSYAQGKGEIDDVIAVTDYARQQQPTTEIWLAGFSFGAVVSAHAAVLIEPARLVSIAPAVNILGKALQSPLLMPWLIVQGDADEVVLPDDVHGWVEQLQPPPKLIGLPGAGHFFHGHLVELRQILVAELSY
jgi:alpha/beta superfamily hydrolase